MKDRTGFFAVWQPRILSILRVVVAILFMEHGTMKLLGYPPSEMFKGLQLFSLLGFAGVLELFGGVLMILGLFTRATAFILSGEMAVAYFMVHAPHGLFPVLNQGEVAVLYCFIFLYFATAGGGIWSFDHTLQRSTRTNPHP